MGVTKAFAEHIVSLGIAGPGMTRAATADANSLDNIILYSEVIYRSAMVTDGPSPMLWSPQRPVSDCHDRFWMDVMDGCEDR